MNSSKFHSAAGRLLLLLLVLALAVGMAVPAYAAETDTPYTSVTASHRDAEFTYDLYLTDQNGLSVTNPRKLAAGDTIFVELRLTRSGYNGSSYTSYGLEFRLMTRGLTYNYDGTTLRGGTDVREMVYSDGNSVGFAWYDMQQVGESINNPVLAASWSYTVNDPSRVNITVPVALIYITGDNTGHEVVGPATLYLDPNGGKLVGADVSGAYTSGEVIILPGAELGEAVFLGWSDGAKIYPAGSEYTVSGVVTLTAVWEELERNRHLTLDPKGGEIVGEDISGYYADGMIVTLPDVQREGYQFLGWSDGVNTYEAGAEYEVYNTVILSAVWEEIPTGSDEPGGEGCVICHRDRWLIPGISICWLCLLILILILLGIWLIILLRKGKTVKYSLVNGDISLDYKNGDAPVEVEVVLYDGDKKYSLNRSGTVEAKGRLKFIRNVTGVPIVVIEAGTYDGKLLICDGNETKVKACRIKALDKELDE